MFPFFVAPWIVPAQATEVVVDGLGTYDLKTAVSMCETETAEAGDYGPPVFQEVVRGLLEQPRRVRQAYFAKHRPDFNWPSHPADEAYLPVIPRAPRVASTCLATANVVAEDAAALSSTCRESADECRARLPQVEWKALKKAIKNAAKAETSEPFRESGSDPWLDQLYPIVHDLVPPGPLLDRACNWPNQAAKRGIFIDRPELDAARHACLQMISLLGDTPEKLQTGCRTGWEEVDDTEWAKIRTPGQTDLALGIYLYRANQGYNNTGGRWSPRTGILDIYRLLSRMDPLPSDCEAPDWGLNYKRVLVDKWMEAQATQSCEDKKLDLASRAHLCPGLAQQLSVSCDRGEALACLQGGRVYQQALGTRRDRAEAVRHLEAACSMGTPEGCDEADSVKLEMADSFHQQLEMNHLSSAKTHFQEYSLFLGADWAKRSLPPLFDAAIKLERLDIAQELVKEADPVLFASWLRQAKPRLAQLERKLNR